MVVAQRWVVAQKWVVAQRMGCGSEWVVAPEMGLSGWVVAREPGCKLLYGMSARSGGLVLF